MGGGGIKTKRQPARIHNSPIMLLDNRQQVQVQPPRRELPLAGVAIRALEVGRGGLETRADVPAAAPLVGDQGAAGRARPGCGVGGDVLDEVGVLNDGPESVGYRQVGALEVA